MTATVIVAARAEARGSAGLAALTLAVALVFLGGLGSEPASAGQSVVRFTTTLGEFDIALEDDKAPVTTANFLRYVDGGFYDGGRFHRTVTADNQPNDDVRIAVIQASVDRARRRQGFAPIALERTRDTGLPHLDGSISMARAGPDTARSDFFLCIGDQPALDFAGKRNADGQGFACFGRVVRGIEVVREIHASAANGQRLDPPVVIRKAARVVSEGIFAHIETEKGTIVARLEFERTPMTVANFVGLAEGSLRNDSFPSGRPFFDGCVFHRVVPGHVIQAGAADSTSSSQTGYQFPNEIHPELSHRRVGSLGMANGGPHTNSSQWYVTLGDRSYLDGDYTVFGEVVAGLEVVFAIEQGDRVRSVRIERLGEAAAAFVVDDARFAKLVEAAQQRVREEERQRAARDQKFVVDRWPDAPTTESGVGIVTLREGSGDPPQPDADMALRYSAQTAESLRFRSTSEAGTPAPGDAGEVFEYRPDRDSVTAGFDQGVATIRLGERRVVIVPANLGYGAAGHYAKEDPGKERFVIRPNSLIVYDVERVR